jgi:hypothetical protein
MPKEVEVRPIDKTNTLIELSGLHVRYIPQAQLEQFWYGDDMMALVTSPHVELLRLYVKHGWNLKVLMKTRYANERRSRRELGMAWWTEKYIEGHIWNRIKIYKSLKKNGFVAGNRPVEVLKEPFWNTRYKLSDPRIKGNEIWNGAGRCAAAIVLGWTQIPGVWVEDAKPGTMKCEKIDAKYRKQV